MVTRWPDVLVWVRGSARSSDVARACGWSRSKQSQLERGNLRLDADDLVAIVAALRSLPGSRARQVTYDELVELATWAAAWAPPPAPAWATDREWRPKAFAAAVAGRK